MLKLTADQLTAAKGLGYTQPQETVDYLMSELFKCQDSVRFAGEKKAGEEYKMLLAIEAELDGMGVYAYEICNYYSFEQLRCQGR